MSTDPLIHVAQDRSALVETIADRFIAVVVQALLEKDAVNVVLTGGSVGIEILGAIGDRSRREQIDWARIHVWWGDERWLPSGDPERNDTQAVEALLGHVAIPQDNIHRFPAADGALDLDAAAAEYTSELGRSAPDSASVPRFDLLFLGVGPDAHIASLFPGYEGIREKTVPVVAVRQSPKPPPQRLSMTLPAINSAERVWLCLAGSDKASALGLALAGASIHEVPASGARGRAETIFFADQDAAAEVPPELLSQEGTG